MRLTQKALKLNRMPAKKAMPLAPQISSDTLRLVGSNIRRIRKAARMTLEQVAHEVPTDTGNLSRLERGEQGYSDSGLRRIAKALNTSVAAFFEERVDYAPGTVERDVHTPFFSIPAWSVEAAMGFGIVAYPEQETIVGHMQLSEDWVRKNVGYSAPGNLAVISAFGDSMMPTFNDGDVILFDRGITQLRLDAVYVVSLNGELFIKRIQRRPDKTIVMKSDNPLYDPYVVPAPEMSTFKVIGKVVFAWNGKKM